MKKFLALLLVAMLALSLVACGEATPPVDPNPEENQGEDVGTEGETPALDLNDYLTEAYMGFNEAEEAIILAFNEDASLSILAAANAEGQAISFVGEGVDNGDGTMTITDLQNELTITFGIMINEDGSITLDMGEEIGAAVVVKCEVSDAVDALTIMDVYYNAVA